MTTLGWECKPYQIKSGKWVPMVLLHEYIEGGGIVTTRLYASSGQEFDTMEEARQYSETIAQKWYEYE